jgi:hypothetical protein
MVSACPGRRLTRAAEGGLLPCVAGLGVQEIESGLWRWTAPHPEWDPDPTATTGWVEEVAGVYCELPGAILLVDPVVPADAGQATRLWNALDRDVERLGRPVCVVMTVQWHRRGADAVVARYGAHDGVVPDGARAIALGDPIGETAYVLPQFRALVLGDVVIGGDAIEGERTEGVRVCPRGWYGSTAAERAWYGGPGLPGALRRLAREPVDRLLTAHGSPLLAGGAAALRALADSARGWWAA